MLSARQSFTGGPRGLASKASSNTIVSMMHSGSITDPSIPFDIPGTDIYLCQPHRLSILSLKIHASTTITCTSQALPSILTSQHEPGNGRPLTASSGHSDEYDELDTHHNPASSSAAPMLKSKRSSLNVPTPRRRPRSADLSAKARGAFQEFRRAARDIAGAGQHSANTALYDVAHHLAPGRVEVQDEQSGSGADLAGGEVKKRISTANAVSSLDVFPPRQNKYDQSTWSRVAASDMSVIAESETQVRPHSFTFGRDSRLTSCSIPLDMAASYRCHSNIRGDTEQTKPVDVPVEFAADPLPKSKNAASSSAAGTFVPDSDSEPESDDMPALKAAASTSTNVPRAPFDPTRLLLKVTTPILAARDAWARAVEGQTASPALEEHSVRLIFRLRLTGSAEATATAKTGEDVGLGEVVFLSAESPALLANAVAQGTAGHVSSPSSSTLPDSALASDEIARLEGISRVVVCPRTEAGATPRGARETDFEWKWADLKRERKVTGSKCCCAFVETDAKSGKATTLAAFTFFVDVPSQPTHFAPPTIMHARSGSDRPDTPSLIAALGGQDEEDFFTNGGPPHSASATTVAVPPSDNRPSSLTCSPSKSLLALRASYGSNGAITEAAASASASSQTRLHLNHTELSLEEVTKDSPILRAAIANLERRTATLKKGCKTALKAAADVRAQLIALRSMDEALDDALAELSGINHATLRVLQRAFLDDARARTSQYRSEELDQLHDHIERPLMLVLERCRAVQEESKHFESESKIYYSQTQKWLSNRADNSTAAVSTSVVSTTASDTLAPTQALPDEKHTKLERSDEKQKIRQLRFDLARVELYQSLLSLHGGDAELVLTRNLLALSAWHAEGPRALWGPDWPSARSRSALHTLTAAALAEQKAVDAERWEAERRCQELEECIMAAEELHGIPAGGTGVNVADEVDVLSQSAPSSAPTKQAGHRIKHLLNALGMNNSPHGSSQPGSTPLDSAQTGSGAPLGNRIKNKVSLKLVSRTGNAQDKTSALASPMFGPLHRLRHGGSGGNEPSSPPPFLATATPSFGSAVSATESTHGSTAEPTEGHYSPGNPGGDREKNSTIFPTTPEAGASIPAPVVRGSVTESPGPRRSQSFAGSPRLRMLELGGDKRSPRIRHNSAALGRVGPDGSPTMASLPSAEAVAATTPPSRPPVANQDRKKEGILWVMGSKPLPGTGSSDGPRGLRTHAWRECWVVLSGSGHLGEYADWKDAKIVVPSAPLIDLRFATVREARGVDRRFAFEVVTREGRRLFQASDEAVMKEWIHAISRAIESLINGTSSVRQIDKVARKSERNSTALGLGLLGQGLGVGGVTARQTGNSDEWGTSGGLRFFGNSDNCTNPSFAAAPARQPSQNQQTLQTLVQGQRAFSQSLTDLTSSTSGGPARLFSRTADTSGANDKISSAPIAGSAAQALRSSNRESKSGSNGGVGHLSTLSESGAGPMPEVAAWNERGISNRTPLSGYVGQAVESPQSSAARYNSNTSSSGGSGGSGGGARFHLSRTADINLSEGGFSAASEDGDRPMGDAAPSAGSPLDDFDRRIEELVHYSYGGGDYRDDLQAAQPAPTSTQRPKPDSKLKRRFRLSLKRAVSGAGTGTTSPPPSAAIVPDNAELSSPPTSYRPPNEARTTHTRPKSVRAAEIDEISKLPENSFCADCRAPDPRWASWSLANSPCCIFLCITCSGQHRSLGVHISRVKSIDLDEWNEEQLHAAREWGNERANLYWEHSRPPHEDRTRCDPGFWKLKYVEARWKAEGSLEEFLAALRAEPDVLDDETASRTSKLAPAENASQTALPVDTEDSVVPAPLPKSQDSVPPAPLPKSPTISKLPNIKA